MLKMMLSMHSLSNTERTENLLDVESLAKKLLDVLHGLYVEFTSVSARYQGKQPRSACLFSASILFFDVQLRSPELCSISAFLQQSTATSLSHSSWC